MKQEKALDKIFVKKWYWKLGIYIMKYANFQKISPRETRET